MNSKNRNLVLWVIISLFLLVLYKMMQTGTDVSGGRTLGYSDFIKSVESNQVSTVIINGKKLAGSFSNGKKFSVDIPNDPNLVDRLLQNNVNVRSAPNDEGGFSFISLLISWFPMLLLIGVWVFFLSQMQSGGNKTMGFGKSRAKLLTEKHGKITFNEVAGVDEAKQEVEEIVDYLKDPRKFQKLGGKIPKGVLLVGSPGTGKTLLARAIAGEANVPFFSISGSDFVEMFVGVGASRVRDLFEQGKKNAPCIVFIDEIDAVGRHRGVGLGGGNDEREQTLNQLLVEMDGFDANEGVILIAATNRPDVLDPALLRPGRFDRQVVVPLPDIKGRKAILDVHMTKVPLGNDVHGKVIARGTPGFSGADLANLVNEAALVAARQNKRVVTMDDFEYAKDKIMMGPERKSMVMSEDEKKLTAYHEGGHALVGYFTKGSDPIHKATIIPRGRALGMVMRLPENDKLSSNREQLKADLAVAMGGRVAEEIIFGYDHVTTGAQSDINYATNIAQKMVTQWGMSDKMGPLSYDSEQGDAYQHGSRNNQISDKTMDDINQEIRLLIDEAYIYAKNLLNKHIKGLHDIANNLLEHETLTGNDIELLMKGKKLNKENDQKGSVKIKKTGSISLSTEKVSTEKKKKTTRKSSKKEDTK